MTPKEFAKKIIASINPGIADISGIGDGTIKGAISELNSNLLWWINNGLLPYPRTNRFYIMLNGIFLNDQGISNGNNKYYNVTYTNETNALKINYAKVDQSNNAAIGVAILNNALDLKDGGVYKKIHVIYDLLGGYNLGNSINRIALMSNKSDFIPYGTNWTIYGDFMHTIGNNYHMEIDISNISGIYYLGIAQYNYISNATLSLSIRIKDIYLE